MADEEPSLWEYTGSSERVYPHVPVTVNPHDVIDWPVPPADDGMWIVHNGDRTPRAPDNEQ